MDHGSKGKKTPDLGTRYATLPVQMLAMVEYWGGGIFRIPGHGSDHKDV